MIINKEVKSKIAHLSRIDFAKKHYTKDYFCKSCNEKDNKTHLHHIVPIWYYSVAFSIIALNDEFGSYQTECQYRCNNKTNILELCQMCHLYFHAYANVIIDEFLEKNLIVLSRGIIRSNEREDVIFQKMMSITQEHIMYNTNHFFQRKDNYD